MIKSAIARLYTHRVNRIMTIPDTHECLDLLRKYDTPEHIVRHSIAVQRVGEVVARGLTESDTALDTDLVRAACLLHDIAKIICIREGNRYHDRRGGEILAQEGLPQIGEIVAQHVVLKDGEAVPLREEHILFYADKRVNHDRIVSLEDRFLYLEETYGKSERAMEWFRIARKTTFRLERRIFRPLTFEPEEVPGLVEELFGQTAG